MLGSGADRREGAVELALGAIDFGQRALEVGGRGVRCGFAAPNRSSPSAKYKVKHPQKVGF